MRAAERKADGVVVGAGRVAAHGVQVEADGRQGRVKGCDKMAWLRLGS